MKTERLQFKKWSFLVAALFMGGACLLTSCNEDLEGSTADDVSYIDIEVTDETQVALTRAAYDGLTTTFEEGDEIGLYAVNGTTAEYSNVKFTLTGGTWVPATKVPSKSTYTYYAYYPYSSSPTAPNFAAAGDENAKFASMISGWTVASDQGTLDKFRANDLMMAKGVSTSGRSVTFTMKHKMALAVVNSETVTYSYSTAPSTKYNVAVTFGGNIPYFDGTNYYLFLQPNTLTAIGGQQLKAGAGKYITGSGGELTESYTLKYSTDGGSSFSTTAPTWLVGVVEDRESDDEPVNFVVTATDEKTTNTVKSSRTVESDPSSAILKAATPVADYDLSTKGGSVSRTTANCYMVHAPGTYKLPLVYGNAIKAGSTNSEAYNPTGTSGATFLKPFLNHAGSGITNPWIKDNGITVNAAELIWQDSQGLVSEVGIDGDYLTFTIPSSTIATGNAVIAAKASGTTVWSWHIWVTGETFSNLTTVSTGSHNYRVTPVNLGWVPLKQTMTETTYAGSTCIVKIECDNGTTMTFTVQQPDNVTVSGGGESNNKQGYQPYYQWGRKDAFIPSTGTANTNHAAYNISGTSVSLTFKSFTATGTTDDYGSIANAIKNPLYFYYNNINGNSGRYGPFQSWEYNLWDAQNTLTNNVTTATKKTIYDPCPPGFCVPTGNLYYYMGNGGSRSMTTWDSTNKGATWSNSVVANSITGDDLFFPASGYRSTSGGTLNVVGSYGYCWSASPGSGSNGRSLRFYSGNWYWNNGSRAYGFPVRAVAEE